MKAQQTIKLYYLLSTLTSFGMGFVAATYVMFLRQNHLSYLETNLVNLVFFATVMLFEVPTGAVADVFGRKASYVISCFLLGLGCLIYSQATTFAGFVFAEVIGGIALTFASGAFEAWLVDRLKELNHPTKLTDVLARHSQLEKLASIAGALLGGWLADKTDLTTPWLAAGLLQLLVGVVAMILMEEGRAQRRHVTMLAAWKSMRETIWLSLKYCLNQKNVRFVVLTGTITALAVQGPNMQWPPFFTNFLGESSTLMGWVWAALSVSVIIGAGLASKWMRFWKTEQKALIAVQMGIGLGIMLTAYMPTWPLALLFFLLHESMRGLQNPLKNAYMHDNIPSAERATIISFESMAKTIGGMIGLVGSGLLAQYTSVPLTWLISGGILFFAAFGLMKNSKA